MTLHPSIPSAPKRLIAALAAALPLAMLGAVLPAQAAVMISQVYGGGGNSGAPYQNDFVELHNNGSTAVSLSGWSLQYSSATGTSWANGKVNLSGSIPAGGFFLVKLGNGGGTVAGVALPTADVTGSVNMSGSSGKLALVESTTGLAAVACPSDASIRDLVGFGTSATCNETANTVAPSNTQSVRRVVAGGSCGDTGNNLNDFILVAPTPRNTASGAGACDLGGSSGGGGDTPPTPGTPVSIAQIQGSGGSSPLVGQNVTTQGVVTKLVSNGFYMQSATPDADPATSEGIFVYTAALVTPAAVGRLVSVTAPVVEFATAGGTLTELSPTSALAVVDVGSGSAISPVVISLPVAHDLKLERYEGMLVTLQGPLTVSQNAFHAQYGQLTLSAGGRLQTPTNVYNPNTEGAQRSALAAANQARRITLDDGVSTSYPATTPFSSALRAGYTVSSVTGVIDFGPTTTSTTSGGDYRIIPLDNSALSFSVGNARSTLPDNVGGNLRVAGANVLNYFTVFTDGTTASGQTGKGCTVGTSTTAGNCRGANNLVEFQRQQAKIVNMLAGLNADAVGLMEIQNRSNSTAAGDNAVTNLVAALNARVGAGTYAAVADPAEGTGTDAIKMAIIYKPAKLAPVGAAVSDLDPVNNRPTLAQTFTLANGEKFTLMANHLKSKGSCGGAGAGDTDAGDGQGCWNATRLAQTNRLRTFVAQRQAATGVSDVLMVGDFNAYAAEDPIRALTSNGFVDQIGRFQSFGYSYVFGGEAGRLDHAISTVSMSPKVTSVTEWHVNADESVAQDYNCEDKNVTAISCPTNGGSAKPADPFNSSTPFRASDHDPVLVGLNLWKTIPGTRGRDTLVGTPGDDMLIGGTGADTLTGGAGTNVFAYAALGDAGDVITDFMPGKDLLDLRTLMVAIAANPATAVANGVVRFTASGADTLVLVDTDGTAGPAAARTLATLKNVSPAAIVATRDLILQ